MFSFVDACQSIGITVTPEQFALFEQYYELLIEWNQKMNLTAITGIEDVFKKHFYDSLTIAFDYPFDHQTIVDVGAGAGFPSIPLKIIYPNLKVTIVDSLGKRITFLNHLIEELGLKDVQAIHARAEEFAKDHREMYDLATARAVARLNVLDELCLPLVKVGGDFLVLKGKAGQEEYKEAKKGITILGGELTDSRHFTLDYDEDHRYNLIIHKVKKTPAKYPRAFGAIKKKPL